MRKHFIFFQFVVLILVAATTLAQEWSGPKFDARLGDPYSQGWISHDCKHVQYDGEGVLVENGADQIAPFGCYDGEGTTPTLSPEFMSIKKSNGIDVLHADYRIYSLPTWQSLTGCSDVTTMSSQMKEEARAHHNYRQSFRAVMDDADDEWEGFTVIWMARNEGLPGSIGMRVKAYGGMAAGAEPTFAKILSGFEARYGCVDPDNDIFGPDNLVVRADPDPATGHDYVHAFPEDDGTDMWHTYRIAVEVGDTSTTSICKIYVDENPVPWIVTEHAKPEKDSRGNYVFFGVGGWNCPKVASMAWVLTTTEGAYGPDELALPVDYQEIYATARSFQEDTNPHPVGWEGPMFDARMGDPYSQGWVAHDCKSSELDLATSLVKENGADSVAGFGCYNVGHPTLSPEYMSLIEEHGIASLRADYRVYTLPTWQSLESCADVTTMSSQMKEEARAHHNYRQSFRAVMDDADDEWEGFTVVWLARADWIPGSIGMRVKAYGGMAAGAEPTYAKILSGFEARYGCVDPDTDIFGDDNLVVRADPDPATGHDYVHAFPEDNGTDAWHIYRIAVEVGDTSTTSSCKIYVDEDPEPWIVTAHAKPEKDSRGNYITWGVGGWNCPKVASMAYVLTTTEGAYGPDERPLPDEFIQIYNTAYANYITGVEYQIDREGTSIPKTFELEQCYPNPFNPSTTIRYHLKKQTKVVLAVFDITGQYITSLVNNREQEAGTFTVKWDGKDLYGNQMSTGAYFYMLKTSEFQETKKMILLK